MKPSSPSRIPASPPQIPRPLPPAADPRRALLDTTGAGDAFIGSLLFSLSTGQQAQRALRLAAVVAGAKCTRLGARPGLPRASELAPGLLA